MQFDRARKRAKTTYSGQFDWLSYNVIDKPWWANLLCYQWVNFGHGMLPFVTKMKSSLHALFRTSKNIEIAWETTKIQHFEIPHCFRETFFPRILSFSRKSMRKRTKIGPNTPEKFLRPEEVLLPSVSNFWVHSPKTVPFAQHCVKSTTGVMSFWVTLHLFSLQIRHF